MAIRISNTASLVAQRYLSKSTEATSESFQRLSSGLRINRPSDDAASLAVAATTRSNSIVAAQGIRNLNDGVSLLNVAEGALQGLSTIVTRQLELAEQSANGAYSLAQRRALDSESEQLRQEFNRIVQSVKFNGLALYDGSMQDAIRVQAGYGITGGIAIRLGDELDYAIGAGSFGAQATYFVGNVAGPRGEATSDLNGDGFLDIVTANTSSNDVSVMLGNGDGTFRARTSFVGGIGNGSVVIGDVTGDGVVDLVVTDTTGSPGAVQILRGNGNGTFKAGISYQASVDPLEVRLGDLNGDGTLDILVEDYTNSKVSVLLNNGNGTFRAGTSFATTTNSVDLELVDVNGDGRLDVVTTGSSAGVLLGNGNGTFRSTITLGGFTNANSITFDDLNYDGYEDLVVGDYANGTANILLGNGDGTFKARVSYQFVIGARSINLGDFNGDGYSDIIQVYSTTGGALMLSLGNGDGTFKASTSRATIDDGFAMVVADFNRDGVSDIALGGDPGGAVNDHFAIHLTNTSEGSTIGRFSILTQERARNALGFLGNILSRITGESGLIGAGMSRISSALSTLESSRSNFDIAYSRLIDADVAEETSLLVRNQILQESATAILSQANQSPALALQLLNA